MDKKLKAKWVRALRSGKYKQGPCVLYRPTDKTFCCMGVLGRIKGIELKKLAMDASCKTPASWKHFPLKVAEELARLNDSRHSPFAEIADYIEETL